MITALLHRYWLSLLKWGAIAGGILLVLLQARSAGRQAQKIEQIEASHHARTDTINKANEAHRDAMRVHDAISELQKHWRRD